MATASRRLFAILMLSCCRIGSCSGPYCCIPATHTPCPGALAIYNPNCCQFCNGGRIVTAPSSSCSLETACQNTPTPAPTPPGYVKEVCCAPTGNPGCVAPNFATACCEACPGGTGGDTIDKGICGTGYKCSNTGLPPSPSTPTPATPTTPLGKK